MNIKEIKEYVIFNKDKLHTFVFHGSRNQNDIFEGCITAAYPIIFTICSDFQVRSFTYTDLLIGNLEVIK